MTRPYSHAYNVKQDTSPSPLYFVYIRRSCFASLSLCIVDHLLLPLAMATARATSAVKKKGYLHKLPVSGGLIKVCEVGQERIVLITVS